MTPVSPHVSVIVAAKDSGAMLRDCLDALIPQAAAGDAEIIVVDASRNGSAVLAEYKDTITIVPASSTWLVPRLWSAGIEAASAPIVALTIGQCVPERNWIEAIRQAADADQACAGFGGAIDGPHGGRWRDWAVYFARYSAYMPPVASGTTMELAGDNAAYRAAALKDCASMRSGFWETLVHDHLRSRGWKLALSSRMRVRLGACESARVFCRERYLHGKHFASTRPHTGSVVRLMRAATAPALAPYLLLRIGSRVARRRADWMPRYLAALPWLVLFIGWWSFGEAVGYLTPPAREA